MNFLSKLYHQSKDNLTDNEKIILKYIISDPESIADLSINELAGRTLTSKSSVYRLAQKLGFYGYAELKYYIANEVKEAKLQEYTDSLEEDISATKKLFSNAFSEEILHDIYHANKIFCYGTGAGQRNVLEDLKRCLYVVDRFAVNIGAPKELELASNSISEGDLLIIVSLSGNVQSIEASISRAQLNGAKVLGITLLSDSLLNQVSNNTLFFQSSARLAGGKEFVSFLPVYYIVELISQELFKLHIKQMEEKM